MPKRQSDLQDECLIAGDLCEELGASTACQILRDAAKFVPSIFTELDQVTVDRVLLQLPWKSIGIFKEDEIKQFVSDDTIVSHLSRSGFENASSILKFVRPRLRPLFDSFLVRILKNGAANFAQVIDTLALCQHARMKPAEGLVKLGYASEMDVVIANSQFHGIEYVDLTELEISEDIVELVPESVSREYSIMPIRIEDGRTLVFASVFPFDLERTDKLRFILNRSVRLVIAARTEIVTTINRLYGQIEGETVDSILMEFSDVAVDLSEIVDSVESDLSEAALLNQHQPPERYRIKPETENLINEFRLIWNSVEDDS